MGLVDMGMDLMAPGRMWEEAGEHSKAIDAYLKVPTPRPAASLPAVESYCILSY